MQDDIEEQKPEPLDIAVMSEEEMRNLGRDMAMGKVFTHLQLDDSSLLGMVFLPLGLGAFAGQTKESIEQIGMLYEYIDKAGPRAINGYPSFFSFKIVRQDQMEPLWVHFRHFHDALYGKPTE